MGRVSDEWSGHWNWRGEKDTTRRSLSIVVIVLNKCASINHNSIMMQPIVTIFSVVLKCELLSDHKCANHCYMNTNGFVHSSYQ